MQNEIKVIVKREQTVCIFTLKKTARNILKQKNVKKGHVKEDIESFAGIMTPQKDALGETTVNTFILTETKNKENVMIKYLK